ncbi:DUF2388 domain-containing protein [Pseudomonas oryzihabitans]|uniref:DUF2388 domain-containing protein n=1 Tax=Pseudomonas oryzihabitans TaxID=47885 RepID=UPI002B1D82CA|nr:DUF2388 domain-containing protein [Pseudomonas oryzihabitans]
MYFRRSAGLLLGLCLATPVLAFDSTTEGLVKTIYGTSQLTTGPFQNKLVLAARDDAAAFVATDGALRGAQLEETLRTLRAADPGLHASDRELAQAILSQ